MTPDTDHASDSDSDQSSSRIGVGDTVRLDSPFNSYPATGDGIGGTYTHGLVVDIISRRRGPDSPAQIVSLRLFNPRTCTLYAHERGLAASGMPQHMHFPVRDLTLVNKSDEGYWNRDPLSSAADTLVPDESALYARIEPLLTELEARGIVTSIVVQPKNVARPPRVIVSGDPPDGQLGLAMDVARRSGWMVTVDPSGDDEAARRSAGACRYILVPDGHEQAYENGEGMTF